MTTTPLEDRTYPPETDEYQRFKPVVIEGTTYTSFDYAITTDDDRPTDWQAVETVDGKQAFRIHDLTPDAYTVWARVSTVHGETVVIDAGQFRIR